MITYVACDLFLSPADVLVNTVNTVGVMGKGIAKDFKRIYPEMFQEYQSFCERSLLDIGKFHLFKTPNKWILNFPTKRHWRDPSQVAYLTAGLAHFVDRYHEYGITSIAFPQLGCGNGELKWEEQVQPVMEAYLNPLPIAVYIHLPDVESPFPPEHRNVREMKQWLRQEPESLAFAEVWDDLTGLLAAPQQLTTRDTGEPFTVSLDSADQSLHLEADSGVCVATYDSLVDLWQMARMSGFLTGNSMPSGLEAGSSHLLTLLAELPYLEPVAMSGDYRDVSSRALGLRLQPRPGLAQLPLLQPAGVLEPV